MAGCLISVMPFAPSEVRLSEKPAHKPAYAHAHIPSDPIMCKAENMTFLYRVKIKNSTNLSDHVCYQDSPNTS